MSGSREIRFYNTPDEVGFELCGLVERTAKDSIDSRGSFKIGLSGGSLTNFLSKGLQSIKTEWEKWVIFFCDERVVPFSDSESTYGTYRHQLIGKVSLTEDNFVPIKPQLSAQDAAEDYCDQLKKYFPGSDLPKFDLLLLGMGPDGHTCSLFPNHPLLNEDKLWIAPITNSPKPPPSRVTLTFPVINNARVCVFAAVGQGKAEMVKRILKDSERLPAGLVRPPNGIVYWLLDNEAAFHLKK